MSNNSNSKKQFILIAVIALVCVALISVAVYFALSGGSDKENSTTDAATEAVTNATTDAPTDAPTDEPTSPSASEPMENAPIQNDNVADDIFKD